jgi:hypothetical protein
MPPLTAGKIDLNHPLFLVLTMSIPMYEPFAFEVSVNSPEKFTLLLNFCKENGIYVPPMAYNPFKPLVVDKEKRLPTKIFKAFCGPENLNSAGMASVACVCDFITGYAKIHKLVNTDGSIELTARMQEAFGTDKTRFYPHEIVYLAEMAFPS